MTQTVEITASELHRVFCDPWCQRCNSFATDACHQDAHCTARQKPGLWLRHPATKPEGLRYQSFRDGEWQIRVVYREEYELVTPLHAAALCRDACLGAMADIADVKISNPHELGEPAQVVFYGTGTPVLTTAPTILEAAARSLHIYLDSKGTTE